MSSVQDVLTSLGINSAISVALVGVYAVLKNQPVNARIYYAKFIQMKRHVPSQDPDTKGHRIGRYINLNMRTYLHVMDWLRSSLKMPEAELIDHAGLDSAVYLRILLLGLQIFIPMMIYSFIVLVPINVTDDALLIRQDVRNYYTYSSLDTITIANIRKQSTRLWAHLTAAYLYTAWTCWLLFRAYRSIVDLRFRFLASQERRPDQFSILCRCIPEDKDESVRLRVDHFFRATHPDHYLFNSVVYNANKLAKLVAKREAIRNKLNYWEMVVSRGTSGTRPLRSKGFMGLWGEKVDRLGYYVEKIDDLTEKIREERNNVLSNEKSVMPAAFIMFESRWAAAVCAQTKQSKDSSKWLTEWAPEPRDVVWANLPIPYLQMNSRRLITLVLLILLIIFFLIPVSFVQSLANLDKIERKVGFLRPLIEVGFVKSVLQGFLPGLSLKIFMAVLPAILWFMSSLEGHVSYSKIEKHACVSYLAFMLVNIFLGNVVAGTALEQIKLFIESPTQIPNTLGNDIPVRATFFITYILVDGWTNCAMDLVRVLPFFIYHFKNLTMVRTERDKDLNTSIGFIRYITALPRLGLYFLLGFVYSTISPLLLPFIIVYFAVAYVVYRNQIIQAYDQQYESAGAYWPIMFAYAVVGLLTMHATLIGLMALKEAASSTPFLLPLPCCTILFWYYCKARFEDSFKCYPLEEAIAKDNVEKDREPDLNVKEFLDTAFLHPAITASFEGTEGEGGEGHAGASTAVNDLLHKKPVIGTRTDDQGSKSSRLNGEEALGAGTRLSRRRSDASEESYKHRRNYSRSPGPSSRPQSPQSPLGHDEP